MQEKKHSSRMEPQRREWCITTQNLARALGSGVADYFGLNSDKLMRRGPMERHSDVNYLWNTVWTTNIIVVAQVQCGRM